MQKARCNTHKSCCLNLLTTLIFLSMKTSVLLGQQITSPRIYSEAPIVFENGIKKSQYLNVKFKQNILPLAAGIRKASLSDFAPSFSSLISYFSTLERRYGSIVFHKKIPSAVWGDVWRRNRKTGQWVQTPDMSQLFIIQFTQMAPIDSLVAEFEKLDEVEYAYQPIQVMPLVDPNDPCYNTITQCATSSVASDQWNLKRIKASQAWDITQGSNSILAAFFDPEGFNRNHPDLTTKFDGGDLVSGSGHHGTETAGMLAAATNNSIGIASLGWNIMMRPYFFVDRTYEGISDPNSLVYDIRQARNSQNPDVDIINLSILTLETVSAPGGVGTCEKPKNYPEVSQEIAAAIADGIIVVAGTGNRDLNPEKPACSSLFPFEAWPAASPNVIGVTVTDINDNHAPNYNYEAPTFDNEFIDVAAPAYQIVTTLGNGYIEDSGTSFAAPQVSALAGLMLSLNSGLTSSNIWDIITNTAEKVGQDPYTNGRNSYLGYGRINAYQALLLTHAYSNKSMSSTATASNNGRRIVKDGTGKYHMVFESGITSGGNVLSEIFYRNSTDGVTWSTPVRLSAGDEQNRYPSIAERSGKLYVAWQRMTGTNTYNILFRHFNGSSWEAIQNITNGIGSNSDPLPVIAVSTPAAAFEMMVVYHITNAIKSQYTTSTNGSSWGSPLLINSNNNANNPSLVYKSNSSPGYFVLTWDDGSNVYHQNYNGSSWVTPAYQVNSASLPACCHKYSSYALSGNLDQHIVWQAYDLDIYQKWVIYHNKNLNSTIFTAFVTDQYDYLRPTGSGHSGGAFSVVWHDASSSQNIRKAYYNGSTWTDGQTGTVLASNVADASLSIVNPPGATAKAIWRSVGNAPYTLTLGPSGGLGKSAAGEIVVYSRRIIYSLDTTAVLTLQMGTVEVISDGSRSSLPFSIIAENDSLMASQLAGKLNLSNVLLPANIDSLVFTVRLYSRNAGNLRQNSQLPLQVSFALTPVINGAIPITIGLPTIPNNGVARQKMQLAFPVRVLRNQIVNLQPVLTNLDVGKSRGVLVHVYETISSNASKSSDQSVETVSVRSQQLSLRVHPNPFNPSATIHFSLPTAGVVSLRIYDVNGRLMRQWHDEQRGAGEHAIVWDGNDQKGQQVTSGTYFSELVYGTERRVAKMVLIR